MSVANKVAMVTGAAQGIGRAASEVLLKNGASVMLADMNEMQGASTLADLSQQFGKSRVAFVKCDITKQDQLDAAFATTKSTLGGIDIVFNNAGIGDEGNGWELTVDVNVKGTMKATKTALDHLRKDKGGRGGVIVNMASMAGLNPNPCGPVYCATKAAVIMFSRCWAMNPDVSANGVRINVLAPAFVDTDLLKGLQGGAGINRPDIAAKMVQMVGVMSVEQLAEAFMELVTDDTKTNAVLTISANTGKAYYGQ
ncbi:hypothetical protein EGW08_017305 [Elysia chlorotica]|uniref:15-hydroxyprostaglandin dehydrogenase [NAD(+)] n=1 Tax=Elysia chlorotica TaxID=188477 RepID=A0A3S1H9L0_ELYCH|nr:hypothetical protein EGW08_017305 [Elysia chlorotica]